MDRQLSENKQLNQYHRQGMFGDPINHPPKCNLLPLIWTYLIKTDGTKEDRCVCNRPHYRRDSVTLAHTYADALDQAGARTFWAINTLHNYKAYGANATNVFAEAPPPKAPLYVIIDASFNLGGRASLNAPYHCRPYPPRQTCTPGPPRVPTPMGINDPRYLDGTIH